MLFTIMFVIIFYIAANHEHLGGLKWAAFSFGLSVLVSALDANFLWFLISQGALFGALWRTNAKKLEGHPQQMAEREEDMRIERQERLRLDRERLDQERSKE